MRRPRLHAPWPGKGEDASGSLARFAAACVFALSLLLGAAPNARADGPTLAIRAGRILPVAPGLDWVIEDGVILIVDGRVAEIGPATSVVIPADVPVTHLPDATIMPGLVAATSNLVGPHAGEPTVSADYRAIDSFNLYGDYRSVLAAGVTTVHLSPGWHRLIGGQGAVVRLGGPAGQRLLRESSDLTITLGESVFNPPDLVEYLTRPSPDNAIQPAQRQRPTTRLGQYLALREAIAAATGPRERSAKFDYQAETLGRLWSERLPLRVQAHLAQDIAGAISFMAASGRTGYLVGGFEAGDVAGELRAAGVPLVYTIDAAFRSPGGNVGSDPDALVPDVEDLSALEGVRLALAMSDGSLGDLRLAAAMARRSGLSERTVVEAITRVPAELLGVADRVGSLAPGTVADILVLNGAPLEAATHVHRVYVGGRLAYDVRVRPEQSGAGIMAERAVVVRGGTIWKGPNDWLSDGQVLIEDGRIIAVGKRVPVPAGAQVIDAGPGAFIAPGFIDAFGHLGLEGDNGVLAPNLSLAPLYGAADVMDHRVAAAGVTTVVAAPYRFHSRGPRLTAVKTAGNDRNGRIVDDMAAVAFDVRGSDPKSIANALKQPLDAGKKYLESWQKYEKDLAEWEKKKAEGKLEPVEKPKTEEVAEQKVEEDPITGTWTVRASGGPIPEPVDAKVALNLRGTQIEGRLIEPVEATEFNHKITGTLSGKKITGTVEIDAPVELPAPPFWEGEIVETDHIKGTAGLRGIIQVDIELRRVDKESTQFSVTRTKRKTTGEDGRPLPPTIDENLEPIRALLTNRIPALVSAGTSREIEAVLAVLADQYKIEHIVFLGAEEARLAAEKLKEKNASVVLPPSVLRAERRQPYHQGDDLVRRGIPVAFQSNAEDGARTLPTVGLYAVNRGMSAEQVLEAMTIGAARMYRIDDRVGSIEPGKDGDLVIFTGHPFDAASRVQRVIINGEEVR